MLMIIDMQNEYIDKSNGQNYVKNSEKMIQGIIDRIRESEEKGKYIYYTSDIPIKEYEFKKHYNQEPINDKRTINIQLKNSNKEEKWAYELYRPLSQDLEKHKNIKKSYYAIPPETLLKLQQRPKKDHRIIKEIEFVGVETHICVLANAICLQSAFPQARIIINNSLCMSKNKDDHKYALRVMEGLGMKIRR